jgi:hypothetical protein
VIDEILPGVFHWKAFHEGIGQDVHSAFAAGTLIDPMMAPEGLDWFAQAREPERIVLTNRHHYRHSADFAERFGCRVLCHRAGLHEFGPDRPVQGFDFGEQLAPGVTALELGAITPEETVLHLDAGDGVLAFADGLIRTADGGLGFVSDRLLGDDPEGVKRGLRARLSRLLESRFDCLLFAHGAPLRTGGHAALEAFLGEE